MCTKAGKQVNALKRISPYLNLKGLKNMYSSFICSNFQYCSSVWAFCGLGNEQKIEKVQKRFLRIAFRNNDDTYEDMLIKYEYDPLKITKLRSMACEVYKCICWIPF